MFRKCRSATLLGWFVVGGWAAGCGGDDDQPPGGGARGGGAGLAGAGAMHAGVSGAGGAHGGAAGAGRSSGGMSSAGGPTGGTSSAGVGGSGGGTMGGAPEDGSAGAGAPSAGTSSGSGGAGATSSGGEGGVAEGGVPNVGGEATAGEGGLETAGDGGTGGVVGTGGASGTGGVVGTGGAAGSDQSMGGIAGTSAGFGGVGNGGVAGTPGGNGGSAGGATEGGTGAGVAGAGVAGAGGVAVASCAVNHGGCDPLTTCTYVSGGVVCGACPPSYGGSGESGCVANKCDGAPDATCACIKVAPTGDDAVVTASYGATPFRNVQPAIDFAYAHPQVAQKVCVANDAACDSCTYPGPAGAPLRMRDGISVFGGYDATAWTRAGITTLTPTTAEGVVFDATIASPSELSAFAITLPELDGATGVTIDGAHEVMLEGISVHSIELGWRGIDVRNGADAYVSGLNILNATVSTGQVFGVHSIGSRVAIDDVELTLPMHGGSAWGAWLEDSPGSSITHFSVESYSPDGTTLDAMGGIAVEGGGDVEMHEVDVRVADGMTQRALDVVGDGTGTVTISDAISFQAGSGTASVECVGVHVANARLMFSGNALADSDDQAANAYGLWLEDAPGSELTGTMAATSRSTATGIEVRGDATGVKVQGADISAVGVTATGVLLSECSGAVPIVSDNRSITATALETGTARAILASACDVSIENNTKISGLGQRTCTIEAIRCNAQSRCVIRDNPDIHNEVAAPPGNPTAVGIACEAGSCAQITGNTINGMQEACRRACTITCTGIDLAATDTLVEGNTVRGGCGDDVVGLHLNGAAAEIRNNSIKGRGTDACSDTQDNVISSFGVMGFAPDSDVDSNAIDGGGTDNPLSGTCGSAAVSGGSLYRNNTLLPGVCYYNASIDGFPSGPFQNNGLGGVVSSNYFIRPGLGSEPPVPVDLSTVNATDSSSGNYAIP